MTRLSGRLGTALLLIRFGPKAVLELIYGQVHSSTEPRSRLARVGKGTYFNRRCSFASPENIAIGSSVTVGPENRLWASPRARLTIEDDVLLGPNVTIVTSNYGTQDRQRPIHDQDWIEADVVLGRGCWLGANVVILPGITIGEGAVIAAGAVVTSAIPAFAIAAGVPAKVLKYRGSDNVDR
jgi:acetyltransferase-like isoleucine patch superfamily enzyme